MINLLSAERGAVGHLLSLSTGESELGDWADASLMQLRRGSRRSGIDSEERTACIVLGAGHHGRALHRVGSSVSAVPYWRAEKLMDACRALPDDPNLWWPEDTIEELVRIYVDKWEIDTASRLHAFVLRKG